MAALVSSTCAADEAAIKTIEPTDYLLLPAVGDYGRLLLHRDAVEAQIVAGTWKNPAAGDTVEARDGDRQRWQAATATEGTVDTALMRGGYAFTLFDAPADAVMILEAQGHAAVYVNGQPHTGDPYDLGWLKLPIRVQQGANTLLFHLAGDKLSARLIVPPAEAYFAGEDHTLPTLVRGETDPAWGAVPIVNASAAWLENVLLECQAGDGDRTTALLPPIPPLSVRKAPFKLAAAKDGAGELIQYQLRLVRANKDGSEDGNQPLAETAVELAVVGLTDIHLRTFRSRIDGSVQPYAVRPAAAAGTESAAPPGIILTLHDAGVTCTEHIAHYAPKSWAHVVAPQGRRPYGFDWEAWGRIDAREALAGALARYQSNPRRVYLTGDSMGGHGVWHLGVTYPDLFAAIGPSDGWISFWSYGGGMPATESPTGVEALMLRGYSTSDTLGLLTNLSSTGVYVQHDPTEVDVPVEQARFLREQLAEFHPNFVYHESTETDNQANTNRLDSPRMMEFFQHSERPELQRLASVDFTTADPAVSADCDYLIIDAQEKQLVPSRVTLQQQSSDRTFVGTTDNVARLGIRVDNLPADQPIDVSLDDQSHTGLPWPKENGLLWFERDDGRWTAADPPSPRLKGRKRYGRFNAAIDNGVLFVYGTQGNEEENRWAEAKARLDAETFYYRGGGAVEVLPDSRFNANDDVDRSVIMYGNAETNASWTKLLPDSPVAIQRGSVRVGDRTETGDDLAVMLVRPRPGSDIALVGVVGGTGPAGMRLTNRLRWYVSGITYPDLMILGSKVLTEGTSGVRAWGYFGPDWSLAAAEIAWSADAP